MLARMTENVAEQRQIGLLSLPVYATGPCGSDHLSFYSRRIPAVFFMTTGGLGHYHQPSDTTDTLNYAGMRQIAQFVADLAVALAESPERPEFHDSGPSLLIRALFRLWGWAVEYAPAGILRLDRQIPRTPQQRQETKCIHSPTVCIF
jgi:hypothetical protein